MRKILVAVTFAAIAYAGCKKKDNTISIVVTASYPMVTITGAQYVSIPVGGSFTPPSATAYDSFYKENCSVVKDLGTLNNNVPGLYTVVYSAKNHYGFVGTANVYVAVTNITDSLDISGLYLRGTSPATITKIGRGLFRTSNVGGDDPVTQASSIIPAVFVVLTDSTFDFGSQLTSAGTLTASQEKLSLAPGDTTLAYAIGLSGFGPQVRNFVKQ